MKKLTIMCGIARSGKSTYVKKLREENKNIAVVSRDSFREAIFGEKGYLESENVITIATMSALSEIMKDGLNVVIDNCNITYKRRKELYHLAKRHGYEVEVIAVYTSPETMFKRAEESGFSKSIVVKMMKICDHYKIDYLDKVEFPNITVSKVFEKVRSDERRVGKECTSWCRSRW